MTLDDFTPTGASFYDAETISALVTDQLRRIWADENAGHIDSATAVQRAEALHLVAMECRADAGLLPRCSNPRCDKPIEGQPYRGQWPWSIAPYCDLACASDHAEAVAAS